MITAQAVPNRKADQVFRPAAQVAPGADAVLLDTGSIGPNNVLVEVAVLASADANGLLPVIAHRNAANSGDAENAIAIATLASYQSDPGLLVAPGLVIPGTNSAVLLYHRERFALSSGERLVIRATNAAAAGETWRAEMDLWVL